MASGFAVPGQGVAGNTAGRQGWETLARWVILCTTLPARELCSSTAAVQQRLMSGFLLVTPQSLNGHVICHLGESSCTLLL